MPPKRFYKKKAYEQGDNAAPKAGGAAAAAEQPQIQFDVSSTPLEGLTAERRGETHLE